MAMKVTTTVCDHQFKGDPRALFQRLVGEKEDVVLLESRDGNGVNNVKSLLFFDNALRIDARENVVTLTPLCEGGGRAAVGLAEMLEAQASVEKVGGTIALTFPDEMPKGDDNERLGALTTAEAIRKACFGWAKADENDAPLYLPGTFAYDYVERFEKLPAAKKDVLNFTDYTFWVPRSLVVVDHEKQSASVVVYNFGESQANLYDDVTVNEALETLRENAPDTSPVQGPFDKPDKSMLNPKAVDVDLDDESYKALVKKCKEHIVAGDVFQIVPSRTFKMPCQSAMATYEQLRGLNPSPYLFFVRHKDFELLGSSPETCVKVSGTPKIIEIHPIAGTRRRGRTKDGALDLDLDSRLEAELKLDKKEVAEHMMLVDLARNDVARISKPGTRKVDRLLEVVRYSHVMHIISLITGELKDDLDALQAYMAAANMGTLVGAPKIEAAKLLREYEVDKRGPYGGAVGYLASNGEMDTAIIIRAGLVRDGHVYVRAGAGVVFDSDPQAEADETVAKASAVLKAAQKANEVTK